MTLTAPPVHDVELPTRLRGIFEHLPRIPVAPADAPPLPEDGSPLVLWVSDFETPVESPTSRRGETTILRDIIRARIGSRGVPVLTRTSCELRRGLAANGKTWAQWRTINLQSLTTGAFGNWNHTTRGPNGRFYTNRVFREQIENAGRRGHVASSFDAFATAYLPRVASESEAFPILASLLPPSDPRPTYFAVHHPWASSDFMAAMHLVTNRSDLGARLFGSRYTPALRDQICDPALRLMPLGIAWQFRGLVPTAEIVEWLSEIRAHDPDNRSRLAKTYAVPRVRDLLRHLDEQSRRDLLRDPAVLDRPPTDTDRCALAPMSGVTTWSQAYENLSDIERLWLGLNPVRVAGRVDLSPADRRALVAAAKAHGHRPPSWVRF